MQKQYVQMASMLQSRLERMKKQTVWQLLFYTRTPRVVK